ncbi:D-isomer specific 2-hydroxyacid dehydrogenase [Azotobacter vinelandii CA]|uniref:D-isomer specific 2-hydroxyacid dehydrogenase n=2 Tax=Azotobacter vinelandii TaxID=354 RepID=C1DFF0_AZOVD|nr:D-isomer specific 2-hydroxyacid dehydrogenase family protein [Azotobacter vinelandii]ACO78353.1 D-isomer specific 2-hydroxyacid dehydrogenase [Azotobacter vinelandii DJ]AGK15041.1 D-isomer specific 2-hydroxyacid dehydrogenase [Azotobacter vinelandii CA]AGK20438.1 D-isomer specific 2-hydroxyacid dehydrogenase [Azotobacter vinelandii CA6]SFY08338.1 Phosphoglycerate dehydrogenase [Azotobacter vinelandii]GLK61213.1 dihydrofolate reductase [Azotobacter vinelandii]
MSGITIASQLDGEANRYLQAQLPDERIVQLENQSLAGIPAETRVLVVRPINVRGVSLTHPPEGWPFRLEWVQLASSGIDAYPDWLFELPRVTSAKGTAAHALAEFALAAIFCAAKRFPELWVKDARWELQPLGQLRGSTLGILGFGSIGQVLADKALALGMRVLALRKDNRPVDHPGVESARDILDLAERADHLVIAAPLTPETRHLVGRDVLGRARAGQHLINIARGGLLDQQALLEALDAGRLSLATLDVTDPEPLPSGHPLYRHPRVRISPHTSAISADSQKNVAARFLENFERFKAQRELIGLVDVARGY